MESEVALQACKTIDKIEGLLGCRSKDNLITVVLSYIHNSHDMFYRHRFLGLYIDASVFLILQPLHNLGMEKGVIPESI